MKRNNIKNRKEKEKLDQVFKTVEDYYAWFEKKINTENLDEAYYIENSPHKPFFLNFEKREDYTPEDRKWMSYDFLFPFLEYISPEDLLLPNYKYGFFKSPWVDEETPIILRDDLISHYSENPDVWEWDWKCIMEKNFNRYDQQNLGGLDIFLRSDEDIPRLELIQERARKLGIQSRIVEKYEEKCLRLRVNKKKYFKYRQMLIDLSREYKFRSLYDYEQIREALQDRSIILIS